MKHHDPGRPIGRCKGCCLNAKTACLAGLMPKQAWLRGRCRLYGHSEVLAVLRQAAPLTGRALAKRNRRVQAGQAAAEPHHNGVLDPRKMAGRARKAMAHSFA